MKLVATAIVACLIASSAFAQQISADSDCSSASIPYFVTAPNRNSLRAIGAIVTISSARQYLDRVALNELLDRAAQIAIARCPSVDVAVVNFQKPYQPFFLTAWKFKNTSQWNFVKNELREIAQREPDPTKPTPKTEPAPAIGGFPVGLIFTFILLIGLPILWFCRHRIGRHFRDRSADAQIKSVASVNENSFGDATRQHEKERQEQLNKLYQAVPLNPPERLRATLAFNTYKTPTFETVWYEGLSAEKQTGFQTVHSVDLMLELSEEERAIVIRNDLQTIVLEDNARYTKRDLQRMRYDDKLMAESHKGRAFDDLLVKEISKQTSEVVRELKSEERDLIHLGDYLIIPYVRTFDHPHEAKQFGDALKTKILPQVKKIIDSYREHKSAQTLEF